MGNSQEVGQPLLQGSRVCVSQRKTGYSLWLQNSVLRLFVVCFIFPLQAASSQNCGAPDKGKDESQSFKTGLREV